MREDSERKMQMLKRPLTGSEGDDANEFKLSKEDDDDTGDVRLADGVENDVKVGEQGEEEDEDDEGDIESL